MEDGKQELAKRDGYILARILIQLSSCCNMLAADANDYAYGLLRESVELDEAGTVPDEDVDANVGFSICCVERCLEHLKNNWPGLPEQLEKWENVIPLQDFSIRDLPNRTAEDEES